MKEERKKQLEELYAAKVQDKAEEISKWIYEHPEDGDQEFLSSVYICEQLKEAGFSVQLPYGSLKTAFRCELKGSKPGATYAFLAEYDALPGYGEQHDELAHACGHNWIGAVCAGVGLMFAQMQEELEGTIVIMGTPAEETTGGKCVLVEEGAFDDVDFTFQLHLGAENNAHVVTLAMDSLEFTFHGKAAHAAAYPHLGVNALDAVNLMFTGISYLRQQMRCDTRVHGIITKGGEACNIIPDLCACKFYIRAADKAYMEEISAKIVNIAKGASFMTGTQMEYRNFENTYYDLVNLESFQQLYVENAKLCGSGDFVDSDADASGSSDVGNVSHVCPMMYSELALKGPTPAYAHDVKFLEYLKLPCADDKLRKGIISLCLTVFDLYDEKQREDIMNEFDTRKD
ncbi:amidohydrolase [[Clostridium] innocuum]|nr:amidohydrolase [[Clostridium] innocuum]